jgi:hypothetical protein
MKKILIFAVSLALALWLRSVAHAQGVPSFQSTNCANSPQYGLASACWDTTLLQWFGWSTSLKQYVSTGGSLPLAQNPGDILMSSDGVSFSDTGISGDLAWGGSLGSFGIAGIKGVPLSGTPPSATIAKQWYITDGAGHYVAATGSTPVPFSVTLPANATSYELYYPYALKFNADFASSTGIAAAGGGCGTAPLESDTYTISCVRSAATVQIGTVVFATNCDTLQAHPPTFATTSHAAQNCDAGIYTLTSPTPATGLNISATLVGQ